MQWQLAEQTGAEYLRRHVDAGGWIVHSALTVPHRSRDPLAKVTGDLFGSWQGMRGIRGFRAAKARVEVLTAVTVFQVLWSARNGWHPHLHVGWLCVGDRGDADWFGGQVRAAWRAKVERVTGHRTSPAAAHSELVFTSLGFWKYCRPDDPYHPKNDCRHRDHPGCQECDDGPVSGRPLGGRPLEILSQVGPAAHRGDSQALAVFAEYLTSMTGRRRIPSGFATAARLYGPVDLPDPWAHPGQGGPRVWIHPGLAAQLELRQRADSPTLADVIRAAAESPTVAAATAGEYLGERVTVDVHEEDGAPILGLASDLTERLVSVTASSPTNQGAQPMRNSSTSTDPAVDRRKILSLVLDQVDNDNHRRALLAAAADVESRAKGVKGQRDAADSLHGALIEAGDPGLQARWEAAIVAQMTEMGGVPGRLLEMALQVNDARSGKQPTARPLTAVDDPDPEDGEVDEGEEVAATG